MRRAWVRALALPELAFLALALAPGCSERPRPSFVLVVVDTLRADHLDRDGAVPGLSPRLDELRSQSHWFENAFANAPWTLPSLASLFVSELPSQHKIVAWGALLPAERDTLAEVLHRAGYRTAAWTANVLIDRDSGFAQGFEVYDLIVSPRAMDREPGELFPNADADELNREAVAWMQIMRQRAPGAPFFVYLHYMEPHTPYACRPGTDRPCGSRAKEANERLLRGDWRFDADERELIRALYRGEVQQVDRAIGLLVGALRRHGFWENTWLFVTADHGEQLGESGEYLHGRSLDRREIRVPLLISGPEREAASVQTPVSLIDVAPTILELAGVPIPVSFRGRSLAPALRGRELGELPAIAEAFRSSHHPPRHRLAVMGSAEKLVLGQDDRVWRFDVRADPEEIRPEPAGRDELSRALRDREAWVDLSSAPEAPEISPELRERLRSLGYDES